MPDEKAINEYLFYEFAYDMQHPPTLPWLTTGLSSFLEDRWSCTRRPAYFSMTFNCSVRGLHGSLIKSQLTLLRHAPVRIPSPPRMYAELR